MVQVLYTELMPEWSGILDVFSNKGQTRQKEASSATSVTYVDPVSGNEILLEGTGFKFRSDVVIKGTIDNIRFTTAEGDDYLTVTGVKTDVDDLTKLLSGNKLVPFLEKLFDRNDTWTGSDINDYIFTGRGNDTLFGGLGDDELAGGKGKDEMTGGDGTDWFDLYKGIGRDMVTDFHADGGPGVQDYIGVWNDNFKVKSGGEDITIVQMGKTAKLVLLGVAKEEITIDDFDFY